VPAASPDNPPSHTSKQRYQKRLFVKDNYFNSLSIHLVPAIAAKPIIEHE